MTIFATEEELVSEGHLYIIISWAIADNNLNPERPTNVVIININRYSFRIYSCPPVLIP